MPVGNFATQPLALSTTALSFEGSCPRPPEYHWPRPPLHLRSAGPKKPERCLIDVFDESLALFFDCLVLRLLVLVVWKPLLINRLPKVLPTEGNEDDLRLRHRLIRVARWWCGMLSCNPQPPPLLSISRLVLNVRAVFNYCCIADCRVMSRRGIGGGAGSCRGGGIGGCDGQHQTSIRRRGRRDTVWPWRVGWQFVEPGHFGNATLVATCVASLPDSRRSTNNNCMEAFLLVSLSLS